MKKAGWIALWAATVCVVFAIGWSIGTARSRRVPPQRAASPPAAEKSAAQDISALESSLSSFTRVLGEKEQRIPDLEAELAELRAKLPPPLSPTEKEWRKEWEEGYLRQKRYVQEGGLELYEGQHELQKKIHQRRDKALRAQGLEELAALMESDNAADVLRGLRIFGSIDFEAIGEDKGAYKPQLLGALKDDNAEVRKRALECLAGTCSGADTFELALNMLDDPSADVRLSARRQLLYSSGAERNEHVAAALKDLLRDENDDARRGAVWQVSRLGREGYDYSGEVEDLLVAASRDSDVAGHILDLWRDRETLSAKVTERVVEILSAPYDEEKMELLLKAPRCEALRPQAIQAYMRILTECLDLRTRQQAVLNLRWLGDRSVIPQLEEMASSPDGEGIEPELKQTIESLERYGK
jgi:hypothetical protein